MAITRVLYAQQTLLIKTKGSGNAQTTYIVPAQSATADETIPQEDVLVLGQLGGAGRLQKDVATCKATAKCYLLDSTNANTYTIGSQTANYVPVDDEKMEEMLVKIREDSIAGEPVAVHLLYNGTSSGGFKFEGACSNISIDVSKGAFPMVDLSFDGVGQIDDMAVSSDGVTLTDDTAKKDYFKTAVPLTTEACELSSNADQLDTVSSLKFSLDMPTETLGSLGSVIQGATAAVKATNKTFSKPPFKSTLTVEGQSLKELDADANVNSTTNVLDGFDIGKLEVDMVGASLSSRSMNQAVGDIGATYNITVEGTDAKFQAQTPNDIT